MFFHRSSPQWSLALLPHGIAAVQLVPGIERPKLTAAQFFPSIGDPLGQDFIEKVAHSLRLKHGTHQVLLPPSAYRFYQTNLPDLPEADLNSALQFQVQDQLPFPVEEALVQALRIPDDQLPGRPQQVFVVVARCAELSSLVRVFQKAGIKLAVLDVAETAQRNLASVLPEISSGRATLSLSVTGMLLTFTTGAELHAFRRMEIATTGEAPLQQTMIDHVVLEVQRSLDNFDRQFSHVTISEVSVLPSADNAMLVPALQDNLAIPVREAPLRDVLNISDALVVQHDHDLNLYLSAIGLALRNCV